jgi:hypothetical protein
LCIRYRLTDQDFLFLQRLFKLLQRQDLVLKNKVKKDTTLSQAQTEELY